MINICEISSTHGRAIREAVTRFIVPLQTTRMINRQAFNELSDAVKALANALKEHDLIPKALLNEIYGSMQVLRNEAAYFGGEAATLKDMANQLEMTFALILIG